MHNSNHAENLNLLAPPLRVLECRVYRGPHLYSHTPMIRLQVDLGLLEEWPSNRHPGFNEALLVALPGLAEHTCSLGHAGGFVERLQEGTWMGHVIEHVAIELQNMIGLRVGRGKTRSVKGKPGHYNIMYAYTQEDIGKAAGRYAMDLVAALLQPPFQRFEGLDKIADAATDGPFDLTASLDSLKQIASKHALGPTTQSLIDEAERRGIPWQRLDTQSLIQFGTGRYRKLVRASITSNTPYLATETASDKELTKSLLSAVNIPVPQGTTVRTLEGALEAAQEIGFPLVVKPLDGNHGRGVTTDIHTLEEVAAAFQRAKEHARRVILEQYYKGSDYRVLVVNGEVVAAAERVPAHVIGNGRDSIAQLIAAVNTDPRRGDGHENVMTRIRIDEALCAWIARAGLTLESVPKKKQHVVLAATANLSTGGTAIDRTDEIHPDNAAIARRAALTIGLDVAGIDFVLPDITRSWKQTGGGIVELNASPGFRMHLHPSEGQPRNVARAVMDSLFPAGQKHSVPVIAVTGTNGKSTTVRMLTHMMRQSGMRVGYTSTSGIFINDECLWEGDASGPKSARLLLRDPTLDVAVLETARGGIVREGLGVMDCDIGAVLNVTEDHLGISGVDTMRDLAAVKSVVVESVHRRGVSVLNADNPYTLDMVHHAGGEVCLFSTKNAQSEQLFTHIAEGGRAVTCERIGGKDQFVFHDKGQRTVIMAVDEIPATYLGTAKFNVENALAAIAMAIALGLEPHIMRAALSGFTSSYEQNPGRFNIYDEHGYRIIMDYAHNPAAFTAFFGMLQDMRTHYNRVIGHISTPGDRRDEDIIEVGRIAGRELDLVIFREAPDRRGRAKGEILRLLAQGAREVGCSEDRIICVESDEEATDLCLSKARPGDLVILTPSEVEACWEKVKLHKPMPIASTIEPNHELRYYA